jgi:ADP-heptose:LPS heptosyltransferase
MIESLKARRILVVALDNLGDLVFASALIPPLRAAFPHATIDLWSKRYNAPIARLIAHLDEIIAADPFWAVPSHMAKPPALPFLRSIADIRRRRYDVALLTGAPWRTAAAVAATGIPIRIAQARHHNHHFVTHLLPADDGTRPVLEEHARLLEPLGVQAHDPRYALDAGRLGELRTKIAAYLPEEFVAFHPFASSRSRCVPLSEWTQLAFAMQAQGLPTLWVGTAAELTELRSSVTHPRGLYVDQLGDGSLAASAGALSLASLFVGHDSGPLHVAGAFGVPVVGVFAPGQPRRTFPQGTGPWRMIARASPAEITCGMIMRELDALRLASPA